MIALRMNPVDVLGLNDIFSGWQTHLGAAMVQWFKTDSAVQVAAFGCDQVLCF